MFKCVNVELETTILAQLKESHQVLVMVSRRLLLCFYVTNILCASCAGISLELTGSHRACAPTGNDQTCWMWLDRTRRHLVWRARNRFWHQVLWTPWHRANGSLHPLRLEEGSVLSESLGWGSWNPNKGLFCHPDHDPWRWCRYRDNDVLFHHTAQLCFKLFTYCDRYSAGCMLYRTHCRVNLDIFAVQLPDLFCKDFWEVF